MILKRCPGPDCHELIPVSSKGCSKHVEPPKGAKVCLGGCGAVMTGKRLRCEPCRKSFANDQRRAARASNLDQDQKDLKERQVMKGKSSECFVSTNHTMPDTPAPKSAPAYTPPSDEEQRKLDREVDARIFQRCGYTKDIGRTLSAAEIAKIAHEITPIEKVRDRDFVAGWTY